MTKKPPNLKSYYGFTRMLFTKYMWASKMFTATSQKELLEGLSLWLQTRGIALVYGPAGVGKSICLRRFNNDIDDRSYEIFCLFNLRLTPLGFMRSLSRVLGLPVLYHQADLFDALNAHLGQYEKRFNKHPVIIFDDADSLRDELLELLRFLANFDMDSEERFSFILSGSHKLAARIRNAQNEALKQRIGFSHQLRGFSIDDALAYVHFHLKRAEAPTGLFSEDAVQTLFHYSKGLPRVINQIAMHALIRAAISGKDAINADFLKQQVFTNSLFDHSLDE
ncbi:ExeA family protein [Thermodesulfobacteriota bacterium]